MQISRHDLSAVAFITLALCAGPCAAQGQLGLNVYGFSYHLDREEAESRGQDNEVNPGLGVRFRVPGDNFDSFLDGGIYRDSARNIAVYAGGGFFWKATERLRLGGAVAVLKSDTYNEGEAFVAPLPLIAYEWRKATLNVVYIPRIESVDTLNTLGFWLTIWR